MKHIPKLLSYLKPYKSKISLYFVTTLLAIIFGLFSFGMLIPVLQVLFNGDQKPQTSGKGFVSNITNYINDFAIAHGKFEVLLYIVIALVVTTILKNLFVYCSLLILNPIRNAVMRQLRDDLYSKTLSLPIGFFTEEKKGDLM